MVSVCLGLDLCFIIKKEFVPLHIPYLVSVSPNKSGSFLGCFSVWTKRRRNVWNTVVWFCLVWCIVPSVFQFFSCPSSGGVHSIATAITSCFLSMRGKNQSLLSVFLRFQWCGVLIVPSVFFSCPSSGGVHSIATAAAAITSLLLVFLSFRNTKNLQNSGLRQLTNVSYSPAVQNRIKTRV